MDLDVDPAPLPPPPPMPRHSWHWVPRPKGANGLEEWCQWLNFLDGILTAHALTGGRFTELNGLMSRAWNISPLAYGTLKFWLFWFGLKCLERTALVREGTQAVRETILKGVFLVFLLVFLWHLFVLSLFP